jgi:hypothetical protein
MFQQAGEAPGDVDVSGLRARVAAASVNRMAEPYPGYFLIPTAGRWWPRPWRSPACCWRWTSSICRSSRR